MATKGIDSETTKRLVLARVREWDTSVGGYRFFDVKELYDRDTNVVLEQSPEAGLDHG